MMQLSSIKCYDLQYVEHRFVEFISVKQDVCKTVIDVIQISHYIYSVVHLILDLVPLSQQTVCLQPASPALMRFFSSVS